MIDHKLKQIVQQIHKLYYDADVFKDPVMMMIFHDKMSELFNYAEITETLCDYNPDLLGPSELKKRASEGEQLNEIADDGLKRMDQQIWNCGTCFIDNLGNVCTNCGAEKSGRLK